MILFVNGNLGILFLLAAVADALREVVYLTGALCTQADEESTLGAAAITLTEQLCLLETAIGELGKTVVAEGALGRDPAFVSVLAQAVSENAEILRSYAVWNSIQPAVELTAALERVADELAALAKQVIAAEEIQKTVIHSELLGRVELTATLMEDT